MRGGNVNISTLSHGHGHRQGEVLKYVCSPENYGIVEPGVYRSNFLFAINFPFVKRLKLKTILYLSPDTPIRQVTQFLEETGTRFVPLGLKYSKTYATWKPISEELIKDALEIILDINAHPVMIMCSTGIHQTGTLVGCLRRLQSWNLNSIVEEYRRFAGSKARYLDEQFIELFDEDLVTLPKELPPWFIEQRCMMEEEVEEYERLELERKAQKLQGVHMLPILDRKNSGEQMIEPKASSSPLGGGQTAVKSTQDVVPLGRSISDPGQPLCELSPEAPGEVASAKDAEARKDGIAESVSAEGPDASQLDRIALNSSTAAQPTSDEAMEKNLSSKDGAAEGSEDVKVAATRALRELPSYKTYYYSRSSPLTTENRAYKRKIIGKVDL